MQQLQDTVRAQVDVLRSTNYLQSCSRENIIKELSNSVAFQSSTNDADMRKGTIHMCPYSTCQATRHNITA